MFDLNSDLLNQFYHSRVGVRLIEGKVDFIVVIFEVILECQNVVIFALVMLPLEVTGLKCDFLPSPEPSHFVLSLPFG